MKHRLEERITGWLRISKLLSGVKAIRVALALTLGAIGAIPLILFTPPFQVPDENWHFYRAYELSEFKILSEVRNGVSGADLPDSLPQLVKQSVYTRDEILYPATPAPLAQTMSHASILLNSSVRHFVAFPGSAYYSPLPYLPQALGIAVGRLFGLGPLGLLYLGRLFNCLTALGLVGFAVYTIPFAEEMILLVGLLPMSLYLYASLSPDAALIGCALVFIALSLAAVARGSWKAWELSLAAVSSAVFLRCQTSLHSPASGWPCPAPVSAPQNRQRNSLSCHPACGCSRRHNGLDAPRSFFNDTAFGRSASFRSDAPDYTQSDGFRARTCQFSGTYSDLRELSRDSRHLWMADRGNVAWDHLYFAACRPCDSRDSWHTDQYGVPSDKKALALGAVSCQRIPDLFSHVSFDCQRWTGQDHWGAGTLFHPYPCPCRIVCDQTRSCWTISNSSLVRQRCDCSHRSSSDRLHGCNDSQGLSSILGHFS